MALPPLARNSLIIAGAIAIAVGIPGFFRFKKYVDEDPRLCITCHRANPEFALWLGGSHRQVACQKCHHTTSEQSVAMLRAYVAGRNPDEKHAVVEVGACAGCHFSHDPHWPQVGGSRGHKLHYEEKKIACIKCHAASMHGFTPMAEKCAECHPKHGVSVGGMQRLHCFACHEFLTNEPGLRPTRSDCMRCHTAQGINAPVGEHGGTMGMDCSACHKPHAAPENALVACKVCHPRVDKDGLHGKHKAKRCVDCHQPHTWKATEKGCDRCHAKLKDGHTAKDDCFACHGFRPLILRPKQGEKPAAATTGKPAPVPANR
jgi:hypothetical protein